MDLTFWTDSPGGRPHLQTKNANTQKVTHYKQELNQQKQHNNHNNYQNKSKDILKTGWHICWICSIFWVVFSNVCLRKKASKPASKNPSKHATRTTKPPPKHQTITRTYQNTKRVPSKHKNTPPEHQKALPRRQQNTTTTTTAQKQHQQNNKKTPPPEHHYQITTTACHATDLPTEIRNVDFKNRKTKRLGPLKNQMQP